MMNNQEKNEVPITELSRLEIEFERSSWVWEVGGEEEKVEAILYSPYTNEARIIYNNKTTTFINLGSSKVAFYTITVAEPSPILMPDNNLIRSTH